MMAITIFMQQAPGSYKHQSTSGIRRELLHHSMENWVLLMYKPASVLRRARVYKKRRGPCLEARAAGISHRRGSWLACRREMLLKRWKLRPRSKEERGLPKS